MVNSTNERHSTSDQEIDLTKVLDHLIQNKWLIASLTGAAFLMGVIYSLLAIPVYEANSLIQVEKKARSLPGISEFSEILGEQSAASTEIQLLTSRQIIGKTVDKIGLNIKATPHFFPVIGEAVYRNYKPALGKELAKPWLGMESYAWGGEKINVDTFKVPNNKYGSPHVLKAKANGRYTLFSSEREKILEGEINKLAKAGDYQLFVSVLKANEGTEFTVTHKPRLSTILSYQNTLLAEEVSRDSGMILLTLASSDPAQAIATLDTISTAYLRQNVERQSAEAAKSLEFLRGKLPEIKQDLEKAEANFNQYQVKVGSVNISSEANALLEQIVDIESSIADLQLKKSELDRKYTPEHPAYQAWREQMNEQANRKNDFNDRIKSLPKTQQELLGLKRDLEVGTAIYTQMLNNIQELDIVKAGTVGNVRIIDPAVADISNPIKPRKKLIIILATLLGGFLSIGIVTLKALLNRGVKTAAEIESIDLPVYASIPLSDEQLKIDRENIKGRQLKKSGQFFVSRLLAQRNPTDIAIESLRSLRTSLHFAMLESSNNVIMISGPSPNVGKSFVSANLAAVVAQAGQRVLLIDMDLRKGYIHKLFGLAPENGVSEILSKRSGVDEAIKQTKIAELSLISRGIHPPNPSELLMSDGLTQLIETVKDRFDLILIDTPPVMAVTDAAIVGRHCGTTMLVTRFGLNPLKEIEATKQRFEQNGIIVKGVVLNAVERQASGYGYGYGYYHYEYKSDKA
jgi:tyrosine-protein kinase Etk/Wzc